MRYKIVDVNKGTVFSEHDSIEAAEIELQNTLDADDLDPSHTFMSSAPPVRIVEADRVWAFNQVTNRWEWMRPSPTND